MYEMFVNICVAQKRYINNRFLQFINKFTFI